MPHDRLSPDAQPDDIRMSFGDHLEELRRRILFALLGLVVAFFLCFKFGDTISEWLTAPYTVAMEELGFDPRMIQLNPIESFMEYFKIALEMALVISAPWILYQLWLFVAAGLYPNERRIVRRFAPASILLFLAGASFMLVVVLSGLMKFLIQIAMWFPLPSAGNPLYVWLSQPPPATTQEAMPAAPVIAPVLQDDPRQPAEGQVWINRSTRHLNVHFDGQTYSTSLQRADARRFVQPFFSISEYLDFVVNLALAFGLGFQIPILVVFLAALKIVSVADMSRARRYVVLGVVVLSAILTPSPDVGTMLLLAVPMLVLYEAGLLVGRMVEKPARAE